MPNWKKVIVSGSDAALSNLNITGALTASGIIYPTTDGTSGQVLQTDGLGNLSFIDGASENVVTTVKNVSGTTLYKGTPVHAVSSSSSGNVNPVIAASASVASTMPATFILGEDLVNEAEGEGIAVGSITGVNTSAFAVGDIVYVGESGGYTNVKPTGSANLIQNLGVVTKVHASNGAGFIYGSGRSNDVPNLPVGKIWVGTANYSATSSFIHLDESNQRLGIGITSPTQDIDVAGGIKIGAGQMLTSNGTITLDIDNNNNETDRTLRVTQHNGANELFRIQEDGKVGIGTAVPSKELTVEGNISASAYLYANGGVFTNPVTVYDTDAAENPRLSVGRGPNESINFSVTDDTGTIYHKQDEVTGYGHYLDIGNWSGGADGSTIRFFSAAADGGSKVNHMIISSSGNVGIGNTAPPEALTVEGNISASGDINASRATFSSTVETGNLTVVGNGTVQGDLVVTGKVTAEEFHTEFVSASIIYQSGSTKFGDTADDIHQFTGSLELQLGGLSGTDTNPFSLQGGGGQVRFDTTNTVYRAYSYNLEVNSGVGSGGSSALYASYNYGGSNPRVGIGTTAPTEKLTVEGNISASGNLYLNGILETDEIRSRTYPNYNILNLEDDNVTNTNGVSLLSVSSMVFGLDVNNNSTGDLFEWKADGADAGSGSLLMALTDEGRLGVGTSTPGTQLQVTGAGYFSGETILSQSLSLDQNYVNVGLIIEEDDYIYTKDSNSLRKLIGKTSDIIQVGQIGTSLIDGIQLLPGTSNGYVTIHNDGSEYARFQSGRFLLGVATPTDLPNTLEKPQAEIEYSGYGGLYIHGDNSGLAGANSSSFGLVVSASNHTVTNGGASYGAYIEARSTTYSNTENYGVYAKSVRRGRAGQYPAVALFGHSTHTPITDNLDMSSDLVGVWSKVDFSDDSIAVTSSAEMYNFYGEAIVPANKIIDDYYGLFLKTPTVNGTITNTRYGIYQQGASEDNYFAGNVGIGTTSPGYKLSISGPSSGQLEIVNSANSKSWRPNVNGNDFYITETGVGNPFVIQAGGNVGIGTTNPSTKLEVAGDTWISSSGATLTVGDSSSGGTLKFGTPSNNTKITYASSEMGIYTAQSKGINFYTNGTNRRMVIEDGGSIGFGVDSPSGSFQFRGGQFNPAYNAFNGVLIDSSQVSHAVDAYGVGIEFTALSKVIKKAAIVPVGCEVDNDTTGLAFLVSSGSSQGLDVMEGMRIAARGNVGIGTTSPTHKLTVAGHVSASAFSGSFYGDGSGLTDVTAVISLAEVLGTGNDAAGNDIENVGVLTANGVSVTGTISGSIVRAASSASFGGPVGIGTTSPANKLDVRNGTLTVRDDSNVNYVEIDRFAGITMKGNGTASRGIQTPNTDALTFGTNATERMRITSAGNVGIGTSSPSYNLHVSGTSVATLGIIANNEGKSYLRMHTSTNEGVYFEADDGATNHLYIRNAGDNTHLLAIDRSSGNVGIGTSTPGNKLEVYASGASDYVIATFRNNNANVYGVAQFSSGSTNTGTIGWHQPGYFFSSANNVNTGQEMMLQGVQGITLGTNNTGSLSIKETTADVIIDSKVKLGIGTASPIQQLDVRGNAIVADSLPINPQGGTLEVYNNGGRSSLVIHEDAGTHQARLHLRRGSIDTYLQTDTAGFEIRTDGVLTGDPALRIASAGDVTIYKNLTVEGIVTAQEFHTEFVSASILYSSGSTKFGNSTDDLHSFTGSIGLQFSSQDTLLETERIAVTTTSTTVTRFTVATHVGAVIDYTVYNDDLPLGMRTGQLMVVADNASETRLTDTSTTDIGDTSAVTFTSSHNGTQCTVTMSTPDDTWNIRVFRRLL